jgi:CubicO group peptidase (beta-lactamase class C family)
MGRVAALGLAALSLSVVPALSQDVDRMDQVIRASADQDAFSGSVLVARNGEVLLDRGYGLANREWGIANAGDTRFRLASVSKQFTAAAVMILKERGLVDLDAPVKTWLPDAPAAWDGVTARRLLNHTAGTPDFTRFEDYEALKTQATTVEALVARFRDRPLDFQPGERFAYSNSGYILLTALIEKASGQTYADFVRENLFQPLGMSDSGYDDHAVVLPRRASGYVPTDDGVENADYVDMSVPQGAGGLYSTTRDLLKWELGLFGGRVLQSSSLTELITPGRGDYALGLEVKTDGADTIVSHSGGIEGFNTYLAHDLSKGMTVVVLGNLNGAAPEKLGGELMTLARGGTVTLQGERQAVALAPETLRTYEGVYELAPNFALTLSLVNGTLTAQATGQKPLELSAEATDAFFLSAMDAQIVFTRDTTGAITGLVLHQGGREMPAKKRP